MCDSQAAHEKTLTALLPALAGANIIYGLGMLDLGITYSFAQLIMDNEFIKMIKHAVGGIPVNDETLAVDVIREAAMSNAFLGHAHTLKHMGRRSDPKLIDRKNWEQWKEAGGKGIVEKAEEEARYIIENHRPEPLPDNVIATLRSIVEEAEEEFGIDKEKETVASAAKVV